MISCLPWRIWTLACRMVGDQWNKRQRKMYCTHVGKRTRFHGAKLLYIFMFKFRLIGIWAALRQSLDFR